VKVILFGSVPTVYLVTLPTKSRALLQAIIFRSPSHVTTAEFNKDLPETLHLFQLIRLLAGQNF
jgi:hypothetical protein